MERSDPPVAAPDVPRASAERGQADAIRAAAEACFSRAGYSGASMREIAEAAGVSKSLLHYHFRSKEHLFVDVQMRAYERLAARVRAAVAPIPGGRDRGLAAFDALLTALRASNDLRVQAELWAAALSNEKLREQVVRLREFLRDLLARSVEDIVGADLRRIGVDAGSAAAMIWSVLNGVGVEYAFGASEARIDGAIGALRTLVSTALTDGERGPSQHGAQAGAKEVIPCTSTSSR